MTLRPQLPRLCRTWAPHGTDFPREVFEAVPAYVMGDETERAYHGATCSRMAFYLFHNAMTFPSSGFFPTSRNRLPWTTSVAPLPSSAGSSRMNLKQWS